MKVARVKGTRDLLPPETARWAAVDSAVREVFSSYGYGEIRTPALEATELFVRSVGETTDIVHKEMFTFTDRGDRSLTLRPENTAGVVRAVVEHRLAEGPMPLRLFYLGPQYRYERPQKGRYREFRQIGAELFGAAGPEADAELLQMLFVFLGRLGFEGLSVRLNAVPVGNGREEFASAVRQHVRRFENDLGEDDRRRMATNPLRLFDSKDARTISILEGAPRTVDYLDETAARHYSSLKAILGSMQIPFEEDSQLVRGLDYYTKSVFEVRSSRLGAQDAILGGGRYDNLVAELGGPKLPAVGFAIGEDRLIDVMPMAIALPVKVVVSAVPSDAMTYGFEVASEIRRAFPNFCVDTDVSLRGWSKQLKWASDQIVSPSLYTSFSRWFAVLVGAPERAERTVIVKDLLAEKQEKVPFASMIQTIAAMISGEKA
jgi:histidyl-tRNA synthetase